MTKSELIENITFQNLNIQSEIVNKAVKFILEYMSISLSKGERIEIRSFGSFSLHYRNSRIGRNPKTGKKVLLKEKYVPHFKPGKELKNRVNIFNIN
ncbi:integration host factor subunit beta [Sodalis-like secondary symbiont of Drepanosiphum platanoidis]|uniref:integration host factor subunit beta n=1 Tax=Sodalis-like secondary symbiont of Drepanosiphum platanoidis TaxID=2994493 RepID=UPI003463DE67